jgi:hypothetical protein
MVSMKELTEEQQIIVAKWEAERIERAKLMNELEAKIKGCNPDDSVSIYEEFLTKLEALSPSHCEHGRSIMGSCMGCEEIERIIHPELFEDESE